MPPIRTPSAYRGPPSPGVRSASSAGDALVVDERLLRRWEATADAVIVRDPSGGPIRPIQAGHHRRYVGFVVSRKVGRAIDWESPLEKTVIEYCEVDPGVVWYMSQPHRLEIATGTGRPLVYVPDVERLLSSGSRDVLEVKSPNDARWLRDAAYAEKLDRAAAIYRRLGWRFAIVEEAELKTRPDLGQVRRMFRARFVVVPERLALEVTQELQRSARGVPRTRVLKILGGGVQAERMLDAMAIRRLAAFGSGDDRVREVAADEAAVELGRVL